MGLWDRWTRPQREEPRREEPRREEALREEQSREEPPPERPAEPIFPEAAPAVPPDGSADAPPAGPEVTRGLSGWIERRAKRVMRDAYHTHAEDLEERAHRVVRSAYERSADDLEERAVRAMRRAIEAEAVRIRQAIEHGIEVKKREVRLSLIVLVVSSLVYLALYWFTHRPEGP